MKGIELEDTIVAISTPPFRAPIGVVKLSGNGALEIAKKIFKNKIKPFKINFGLLDVDGIRDECIILYFKKPKSYTGEDLIEIQTHGNPLFLERIVKKAIELGARHAQRGEFTLRAFLNGKKDLIQAEAVNSIINSITEEQLRINTKLLEGHLQEFVENLREEIIEVISELSAEIEFPDYEIEIPKVELRKKLSRIKEKVSSILKTSRYGEIVGEGIKILILGKPNSGKSTYINALIGEERVIVSDEAGTTRDVIREIIDFKGLPFMIYDTAGIRSKHRGKIEHIGIEKALKLKNEAHFIIFLIDSEKELDEDDRKIFEEIKDKEFVVVLNKIDKEMKTKAEDVKRAFGVKNIIEISAKKRIGIEKPLLEIYNRLSSLKEGDMVITERRQRIEFEKMKESIESAIKALDSGFGEEIIVEELRQARDSASRLLGEIYDEDILHHIFDNFCVGK